MTSVPKSASVDDIANLRLVDPILPFVRQLDFPELEWRGPLIVGDGSTYTVSGDPTIWQPDLPLTSNHEVLILANGDPRWYAHWLTLRSFAFVSIDLHSGWLLPIVRRELLACVSRANIVTCRSSELTRAANIGVDIHKAVSASGAALIVKHGKDGVEIFCRGKRVRAESPRVRHVRCDIGAGDLLLGALTAECLRSGQPLTADGVECCYRRCTELICELLEGRRLPSLCTRGLLS